jgi:hypothetical protein
MGSIVNKKIQEECQQKKTSVMKIKSVIIYSLLSCACLLGIHLAMKMLVDQRAREWGERSAPLNNASASVRI